MHVHFRSSQTPLPLHSLLFFPPQATNVREMQRKETEEKRRSKVKTKMRRSEKMG